MLIRGGRSLVAEIEAVDVSVFDDSLRNNAIGAGFVK
jgi:hypothetical protein